MEVENAWLGNPDYEVSLVPVPQMARVWHDDLLLAESKACLRLEETRHVDRLYFPEDDVRWEHFTESVAHTACPYKGVADYWHLAATDPQETNIVWTYRTPFDEVGGIKGYVCFYQERLRIELIEEWPGPEGVETVSTPFPTWGDASDLLYLIDVQPSDEGHFVGPTYRDVHRNVVEGGQMLAQAVVAASKSIPHQRVVDAYMIFSRAATFDSPLELDVDIQQSGRTFSTVQVSVNQTGKLRSVGLLLLDSGATDAIRHAISMPDVGGPYEAEPLDRFRVTGREIRVVGGMYSGDPERIGPAEISAWCRFHDSPDAPYLHAALMAQSATHWTVAAAMLPHEGFGEDVAHLTYSTGAMSIAMAFHEVVDVTEWLLYVNPAIYSGNGLVQGEGHVFRQDGQLVASYTVHGMVREFPRAPSEIGRDWSNAM